MPRQPRWKRRKEDRPDEIVRAALDVFAARGFAAARLEDVASRAGVSKGTLYLYFDSKEELFKEVVRRHLLPNLALAESRLKDARGSTKELLAGIVTAFAQALVESGAGFIPKLVIAEAGNFPDLAKFYADEVVGRGLRLFNALLERGAAQGEFRAVDARLAAPAIAGPLLLLVLWKTVLEPHAALKIDARRYLDSYLDILFNGLATRAGD